MLLAAHGEMLPKPEHPAVAGLSEARLNATNDALQPSAGGIVEFWLILSRARSVTSGYQFRSPDTDVFAVTPSGTSSSILRLLTVGDSRESAYEHMAEV